VGFIWGSIVFATPSLKNAATIPYISIYPAISFPLLILWIVLAYFLARIYLKGAADRCCEGKKLGTIFAVVSFLFDLIILAVLLGSGIAYFLTLSVWLAYLILLVVPWLTGCWRASRAET
jgi:hypothetical protein